jgi:hypothetical protein
MKQTNVLKIAVALVFMTYHISTQAQTLTMDAELRSRSELRSGFKNLYLLMNIMLLYRH